MTNQKPRGTSISTYDPILGPVLAAHATSPPRIAALAVTCRALDAGIPPHLVRIWLRSRGGKRFATITSTPRSFQRVLSAARTKVNAVSSLPARRKARVAAARRLVGCLLTPVPEHVAVSPHRQAMARHALAVIGLDIIDSIHEKGWDTALVSAAWLGVEMGVEEKAARVALNTCVELRWLRVVTKRQGSAARFRLRSQLTRAQGAVADEHTFVVDALAEGTPPIDAVAEVIAVASHAGVGHGVGSKPWLAALANQADVTPRDLGLTRARRTPPHLETWLTVLPAVGGESSGDDLSLIEMLDAYATRTGAGDRKSEAMAAREEAAERRRVETEEHRALVTKMNKALDRLLRAHPIPSVNADRATRRAWVEALTATIAQNTLTEDVREQLAKALAGRLKRRHWSSAEAERVSRFVCGLHQKEVAA